MIPKSRILELKKEFKSWLAFRSFANSLTQKLDIKVAVSMSTATEIEEEANRATLTFSTHGTSGGTVVNARGDYNQNIGTYISGSHIYVQCPMHKSRLPEGLEHFRAENNERSVSMTYSAPHPSFPQDTQITTALITDDIFYTTAIRSVEQVRGMIDAVQLMINNRALCSSDELLRTLDALQRILQLMELALRAYQHTPLVQSLSISISVGVEDCVQLLKDLIRNLSDYRHTLSAAVLYFIRKYVRRWNKKDSTTHALDSKLRQRHRLFAASILALGRAAWLELECGRQDETLAELARFYVSLEQESPSLIHIKLDAIFVLDHLWRKLPVPMIFCDSPQNFHVLIAGFCRNVAGGILIRRGDYRILNPYDGQVINSKEYSAVFQQGMTVEMSIVIREQAEENHVDEQYRCPRCNHSNNKFSGWVICRGCAGQFNRSTEKDSIVSIEVEQDEGAEFIPNERFFFRRISILQNRTRNRASEVSRTQRSEALFPATPEASARDEVSSIKSEIARPLSEATSEKNLATSDMAAVPEHSLRNELSPIQPQGSLPLSQAALKENVAQSDGSEALILFPNASDLAAGCLLESEKEARLLSKAAPDKFKSEREAQEESDPTNTLPQAETSSDMENRKHDEDVTAETARHEERGRRPRRPRFNVKHAIPARDAYIIIMGVTGTGKSTFMAHAAGGDALAESVFIEHSLLSRTDVVNAMTVVDRHTGRNVVLVESHGFDDTSEPDLFLLQTIADFLEASGIKNIKLAGIIFLHRISDNRKPSLKSKLEKLTMFKYLVGAKAIPNIAFVSTMWSTVSDPSTAKRREIELCDSFWKEMLVNGAAYHRFEDTTESAWDIINPLLDLTFRQELSDGISDTHGGGLAKPKWQSRLSSATTDVAKALFRR